MDQEQGERELQLLLLPAGVARVLRDVPAALASATGDHPQLDLDLSMSIGPRQQLPPAPSPPAKENRRAAAMVAVSAARHQQQKQQVGVDVRAVKQQTAEQVRRASAERVRELELAKKEFACARMIWEHAREEVVRVERMKEIATQRLGSAASAMALEITCHACMQCFHL